MAERRLYKMPLKGAQIFKNPGRILKFQTPDMCHEGSYTMRTHQHQGTAAQNLVKQVTCRQ
jgi:hypothetical protein